MQERGDQVGPPLQDVDDGPALPVLQGAATGQSPSPATRSTQWCEVVSGVVEGGNQSIFNDQAINP